MREPGKIVATRSAPKSSGCSRESTATAAITTTAQAVPLTVWRAVTRRWAATPMTRTPRSVVTRAISAHVRSAVSVHESPSAVQPAKAASSTIAASAGRLAPTETDPTPAPIRIIHHRIRPACPWTIAS